MTADRSRVVRLINASKRVDVVTLSPCDGDQDRQAVIRKLIDESVRASDRRSLLVVTVEV